jgi:oxygen-independent coproporphyrinogen-3 oxidase
VSRGHELGTKSAQTRAEVPRTVSVGGFAPPQGACGPARATAAAATVAADTAAEDTATGGTGVAANGAAGHVRHLYVHLPFCAHRCGYCDFVTVVGRTHDHGAYVDALLAELALERHLLAPEPDTIFLGGGTPTFTAPAELERLLAALPRTRELTVEANPETITPELAALLREHGVNRVSLGAQSFQPQLLETLERRATPATVRRAFATLRAAGFDNLSLDLVYGIPGQSPADLADDLAEALALGPEHLSCYELEAKPGTRFTHAHGDELARQVDAMEGYFETVVETLTAAGYRWYETANFCRRDARDLRAQHNLGYWRGRDYLGLGVGAVSTVGEVRWRNAPSLLRYLAALARGERPEREVEPLAPRTRAAERVLLGLRLDEPLATDGLVDAIDADALERMRGLGLALTLDGGRALALSRRGRFLGGGVTAELLT